MTSYTSEFVGSGHADKICDQISDAALDACLEQDPESRVALETAIKAGDRDERWNTSDDRNDPNSNLSDLGSVYLVGEITTKAVFDIEELVRQTIRNIGYSCLEEGIDPDGCVIRTHITRQSEDISRGVTKTEDHEQGAGDQGMMYGYACDETPSFMPKSYVLARDLIWRLEGARRDGRLPWLRPDCKSQVTVSYEEGNWILENLTIAAQHTPEVSRSKLEEGIWAEIINPFIAENGPLRFDSLGSGVIINGTGRFEIGGPLGDSGVTGRKIIVDTYGGRIPHGGGAFSGKDPSKVDRSGHYMARYIAKSVVSSGLARECQVRIAYTIGIAKPNEVEIETFGNESPISGMIARIVQNRFDLRPEAIVERFHLKRPIYLVTASGGHFGREPKDGYFPWEKTVDLS